MKSRRLWIGLAFISPWIVGFLLFTLYPAVMSLWYSLCDYDVLSSPVFVGTLNYRDLAGDSVFWKALWNTIVFASVSLPASLVVALAIALLLNQPVHGQKLFRTMFFVPSVVPAVAVSMIWLWLLNGHFGLINYGLSLFGIQGPNWLADPNWTKPALLLTSVWQTGGTMVIFLAALQDVPRQLYESAAIDGANSLRQLWHITLPAISRVIYFNLIIGLIGTLQIFAGPFIMLGNSGGPNRSALFYTVYLYQNAFNYNQMGYASAMAWVLVVIVLVLAFLATRISKAVGATEEAA